MSKVTVASAAEEIMARRQKLVAELEKSRAERDAAVVAAKERP
jgi:hypothetical protein